MADKVVTKSKLKKFGDELYNKIKTYVDNKLTPADDTEFDKMVDDTLNPTENTTGGETQ